MRPDSMYRLLCVVAIFVALGQAQAGVITISTSLNQLQPGVDNQGWVSGAFGNGNPTNDNYLTGSIAAGQPEDYRSYFFFDLTSVNEPILSATLELRRYGTDAPSIEFFDVSTSPSALIAFRGTATGNPTIFNDLGTGVSYGSFAIGTGSSLDVLSFVLNADAVSAANLASGYFAIGGRVNTRRAFAASGEEPGNGGANFIQQLVLVTGPVTIPEPGSLSVWIVGTLAAGIVYRRKKHSPIRCN